MVDERLTVEFENIDKAILDLKKGMDTLVQSLRANGNIICRTIEKMMC